MAERVALEWIEPYLDGQLGSLESALFDKAVRRDSTLRPLIKTQRSFHAFLQKSLRAVQVPEGLEFRIRLRLSLIGTTIQAIG